MDVDDQLELDLTKSFGKELMRTADFTDILGLDEWVNRSASLLANQLSEMLSDDGERSKMPDQSIKDMKGYVIWEDIEPMFNETCPNKYLSLLAHFMK